MATMDRREKLALDEAYSYYLALDKGEAQPELYRVVRCFKTVTSALSMSNGHHFKLTRQLWKRIQQALFDRLITSFPGYVMMTDADGEPAESRVDMPEEGIIEFHPDNCRRKDDIFRMDIKHMYPATHYALSKSWKAKGSRVSPADMVQTECGPSGCFLKPVVLGQEVLDEEAQAGKDTAYKEWWDLYWQAYCTKNKHDQTILNRQMDELESVWGNLYY